MPKISEQAKELRKLWSGFQTARVMLTANNFGVFDRLIKQKTSKELAKDIGTDKRATGILLDALAGLGLLRKQGSRYKNAAIASQFLVSRSPFYQGDIMKHMDTLWDNWSSLDNVIKTGNPCHKSQNHQAFILGMHNLAVLRAGEVIKEIGLKGVKRALDLGSGPGTYAAEMAKRGVDVVLFDTSETIKIARGVINKRNIKNIDFTQGDFLYDDIGSGYDLIFISQILHAYSEKNNIMLLKKCRKALNNNGKVVIQEFFIRENMTYPVQSALFSINMLVGTEGGRCYSPGEMKTWFLKTGFKNVRKKLVADNVLISAEN